MSAQILQNWLLIRAIPRYVKSWKNLLANSAAPVDLWVAVFLIFQVCLSFPRILSNIKIFVDGMGEGAGGAGATDANDLD
jgi:hypothetical protein